MIKLAPFMIKFLTTISILFSTWLYNYYPYSSYCFVGLQPKQSTYYRAVGSNFFVIRPTIHRATYVYREFRVMSGHKCKLLCEA